MASSSTTCSAFSSSSSASSSSSSSSTESSVASSLSASCSFSSPSSSLFRCSSASSAASPSSSPSSPSSARPASFRHRVFFPHVPCVALLFIVLFLFLVSFPPSVHSHRHRRHHHGHHHEGKDGHEHHHRRHIVPGHHFMVKIALRDCKVPSHCRPPVESALLNQTQVPQCDAMDYFELLWCLDKAIMSRTNVTKLNSQTGEICCEIDHVTGPCRQACRSALYAPTLGHELKQLRIDLVCNREHGDGISGDNGLIQCLATTDDWLSQKHKVMRRRR